MDKSIRVSDIKIYLELNLGITAPAAIVEACRNTERIDILKPPRLLSEKKHDFLPISLPLILSNQTVAPLPP